MALTQPASPSLVKLALRSRSRSLHSSRPCLFRPGHLPCPLCHWAFAHAVPSTRRALPPPSLSCASGSSHDSDLSASFSSLGKLLTFLTRSFFPLRSQSTRLLSSVTLISDEQICIYSCDNRASLVAQTVKNLPAMQETWVPSLCQEGMANPPVGRIDAEVEIPVFWSSDRNS